MTCMVKVEFGDRSLGESPKVDCGPESPAELNFNANLNCTYDDPLALDEISYKPVVCKYDFDFSIVDLEIIFKRLFVICN